jgi:hypothetical protein
LNIRRKGAGVVASAVLLSGLFATVVAPIALADVTPTTPQSVPRGGSSSSTVGYTFLENAASCFELAGLDGNGNPTGNVSTAVGTKLIVQIKDSGGAATVGFSGTPVVVAPGTLGTTTATLSNTGGHSGDTLNVNFTNSSGFDKEQIVITGLTLNADAGAATGAIKATLTGTERGCVIPGGTSPTDVGTTTATGTVSAGIGVGATSVNVAVTAGSCPFAVTAAPTGKLNFLVSPESIAVVPVVTAPPTQTLPLGAATANAHAAAEAVSQTVVNCNPQNIGSPGSVANALRQTVEPPTTVVLPGQTGQAVADTVLDESTYGSGSTLAGTITFTISTAGVTFSGAPRVTNETGGINLGSLLGAGAPVACNLSVDRKSCSVTITSNASGTLDEIELDQILVDVDGTATLGAAVKIAVTAGAPVIVSSSTVAFIGRTIVSTAAQPVVFIGGTDQATGTIILTESQPGFFSSPGGPNNFFTICWTDNPDETFTRQPWAVVTAGDLKLLSGSVGVTQIQGTLIVLGGNQCAFWRLFNTSTVASTIKIVGSADGTTPLDPSGANNGPRINVPSAQLPGSVQGTFSVGAFAAVGTTLFSNAIRAFQNSVTVTAASQPRCLPGATDCLAGNIVVTETQNGQLRLNTKITVNVLPRATTQRMDVLLQTTSTNQTPIVTTNAAASGLLVTPVGVSCTPSAIFGVVVCNFFVTVTQQSFGPTFGTLTFSNIHYVVAADAVNGPVNVDVAGVPTPAGNGQTFDSVVSNAVIGAAPVVGLTKTSASSAVGKTQNSILFTVGTKIIHVVAGSNNIATIRIRVDPALIGKTVAIEVAAKASNGTWSAFHQITSRVIGADGFAYYYATSHSARWLSFRGHFLGDATHGQSTSQTVQIHWVSP